MEGQRSSDHLLRGQGVTGGNPSAPPPPYAMATGPTAIPPPMHMGGYGHGGEYEDEGAPVPVGRTGDAPSAPLLANEHAPGAFAPVSAKGDFPAPRHAQQAPNLGFYGALPPSGQQYIASQGVLPPRNTLPIRLSSKGARSSLSPCTKVRDGLYRHENRGGIGIMFSGGFLGIGTLLWLIMAFAVVPAFDGMTGLVFLIAPIIFSSIGMLITLSLEQTGLEFDDKARQLSVYRIPILLSWLPIQKRFSVKVPYEQLSRVGREPSNVTVTVGGVAQKGYKLTLHLKCGAALPLGTTIGEDKSRDKNQLWDAFVKERVDEPAPTI